jgi:polyhydroxybutyrate depolymerase
MKRCSAILLVIVSQLRAQDLSKTISIEGVQREYIVHIPSTFDKTMKHPLVFIFHGGGTAKNSIAFFGMNPVADTAGFIAVYPNGLNKGWNDGRKVRKHTHDDVGFIRQLLQQLTMDYPVDDQRIFATGISNGGFFSFALALHLSDKFRAIAPVCASIPRDIFEHYNPARPVSILLINGTQDPLVPYDGGKVGGKLLNRGQCASVDETIAKFVAINHCNGRAVQSKISDHDPHDQCMALRFSYPCSNRNVVQQIKIEGGGHTWPGGKQYLSKRLVGNVCRDFSACTEVWDFFRNLKPTNP